MVQPRIQKGVQRIAASGVFEKNSRYSFFAAMFWCSELVYLQLKHIQKPEKTAVLDLNFRRNEYCDPHFFLISGIVITQRTDTEKVSHFLGMGIRTGSSYLKSGKEIFARVRIRSQEHTRTTACPIFSIGGGGDRTSVETLGLWLDGAIISMAQRRGVSLTLFLSSEYVEKVHFWRVLFIARNFFVMQNCKELPINILKDWFAHFPTRSSLSILENAILTHFLLKVWSSVAFSFIDHAKATATCSNKNSLKSRVLFQVYNTVGYGHRALSVELIIVVQMLQDSQRPRWVVEHQCCPSWMGSR